jgi:hypothetical protein
VVLDDVTDDAILVKVAATPLRAKVFTEDDLYAQAHTNTRQQQSTSGGDGAAGIFLSLCAVQKRKAYSYVHPSFYSCDVRQLLDSSNGNTTA